LAKTGARVRSGAAQGQDNYLGGAHLACGRSAADAKAEARKNIAESFAAEGLYPSACRRAASSYRLRVVAGPLGYDEARAARDAWEGEDWETALRHARPQIRIQYGLPPRAAAGASGGPQS
jgi:hypothetical protein